MGGATPVSKTSVDFAAPSPRVSGRTTAVHTSALPLPRREPAWRVASRLRGRLNKVAEAEADAPSAKVSRGSEGETSQSQSGSDGFAFAVGRFAATVKWAQRRERRRRRGGRRGRRRKRMTFAKCVLYAGFPAERLLRPCAIPSLKSGAKA